MNPLELLRDRILQELTDFESFDHTRPLAFRSKDWKRYIYLEYYMTEYSIRYFERGKPATTVKTQSISKLIPNIRRIINQ